MIIRGQSNMICVFGKYIQSNIPGVFSALDVCNNFNQQVRYYKHWNPAYKKLRREKFIKVDLPNFEEDNHDPTPEEIRSKYKQYGLLPQKKWMERPLYISCTPTIIESYVPPQGDGKFSMLISEGAKHTIKDTTKTKNAIRKIKSYDDKFNTKEFPYEAVEIYTKAHEALAAKDTEAMRQYVTEHAYGQMIHNTMNKTIRWKLIESLEPPRVVHARCAEIVTKTNVFAQVTLRMYTQQILSIYDRFGRLMQGSDIVKKDVLEYIVFEKHLANEYGFWRLHGKIIPSWMPSNEVAQTTYVLPKEDTEETEKQELSQTPKQDTVATSP